VIVLFTLLPGVVREGPHWDADLLAAVTGDQASGEQMRALLARARETMLVTRSLATDLLSETTPVTWDPHRVQILVFSVVFGSYYISQLNRLVALPDFSSSVLTLFGISSATYLGFKVVKAQTYHLGRGAGLTRSRKCL
jgi:hypothetical protein